VVWIYDVNVLWTRPSVIPVLCKSRSPVHRGQEVSDRGTWLQKTRPSDRPRCCDELQNEIPTGLLRWI